MTIAEEFKAKIKAGKFAEALTLILSESIEFKVTTWIGQNATEATPSDQFITTSINLAEGKIENTIGEKILKNQAYQQLCQLHFEQVQQGQQIIFNNLNSFQSMLTALEESSQAYSPQLPANSTASLPFEDNSKHDSY